jgi:hypothetical protein
LRLPDLPLKRAREEAAILGAILRVEILCRLQFLFVILASFLFLAVLPVRSQISPGPLSRAHQFLSGPTQCVSCHQVGSGSAVLKCQECHTEIAQRLAQARGLHARFANKEDCAKCHSEHNGEGFPLIRFQPSLQGFDHSQTGYVLQGKHAGLECRQCHKPERIRESERGLIKMKDPSRTFLGLSQDCVTCHEDIHRGRLGQNCLQCHNFVDWKAAKQFDHSKTRFPLTGLHAQVVCEKCHVAGGPEKKPQFTGIPFGKCSDCHKDPHRGAFVPSCETCHTTAGWRRILPAHEFDHSKTRYPLLGKHAQVDCLKCHAGGDFKRPVAFAKCSDCHTPDPHGGQFRERTDKGECSACHNVDGFKPSLFGVKEHAATAYALEGKHASVACAKCHIPAGTATRYNLPFARCLDCHTDAHQGQFSGAPFANRCEACHTVSGFQPSTFTIALHQKSRYPLQGAHLAVACSDCHSIKKAQVVAKVAPYRFEDRTCTGCHRDPHHGEFKEQMARRRPNGTALGCEACHSVKSWTDLLSFDHSKTPFPLTGAHVKVNCEGCHKPTATGASVEQISFKTAHTQCSACHQDAHAGQFAKAGLSEDCAKCHNTIAWKPSLFDHERGSTFSLKGAHKNVSCDLCHKLFKTIDQKRVLFYKPTPRDCASCHN